MFHHFTAVTHRLLVPGRQLLSTSATTRSEPLRVLFCGSDLFSCASLRALHREQQTSNALVQSLDVMVLPPRRTGRGLKHLREVPCETLASELGLRIHQRDTFRNWDIPVGTNLIIVVSFGLFVPRRILKSAKYGGLNVHPSLLPDLRGPAPLHHAMMRGDLHYGISLQTLDDKAFDHGVILRQTPRPGVPISTTATLSEVLRQAADEGAEMLVQGLRDGLHLPPYKDAGWKAADLVDVDLVHAPKIAKAEGQVDWTAWSPDDWVRRVRVLESVWATLINDKGDVKRLVFHDGEVVEMGPVDGVLAGRYANGQDFEAHVGTSQDGSCLVMLEKGYVRVKKVTVDGKQVQDAATALRSFIHV